MEKEELPITELHQVGNGLVHLIIDRIDSSDEYMGLMEGSGICLANSFRTRLEADAWLHSMFSRLFPSHFCELGCVRLPGWHFVADLDALEDAARLPDRRNQSTDN